MELCYQQISKICTSSPEQRSINSILLEAMVDDRDEVILSLLAMVTHDLTYAFTVGPSLEGPEEDGLLYSIHRQGALTQPLYSPLDLQGGDWRVVSETSHLICLPNTDNSQKKITISARSLATAMGGR